MQASSNGSDSESLCMNDIINLLQISANKLFNAKDADINDEIIQKNVQYLYEQDYVYEYISNTNGELCLNYPRQILVPIVDKWSEVQISKSQSSGNIRDQCIQSRLARCRCRFVVPALFVDGKYVCRSSTLSSWGEIYPRLSMEYLTDSTPKNYTPTMNNVADASNELEESQQRSTFDKIRGADIDLLKIFDVGSIVNLMVQKRHAFLGMNITASEKLDKYNRYRIFQMILLPYPGCEHFREVAVQKYNADFVLYDWSQSKKNDAILEIPLHLTSRVDIDWLLWQKWNTVHLTQNYLQILIRHLETDKHGILIHCLSGWDRTPLFISLIRLSLWADGSIHQSLTAEQILYLTLAYDWYLFGHNLSERLLRGEEILYFTFMILPYLVGDEFIFQPSSNAFHQHEARNSTSSTHEQPCQSKSGGSIEHKRMIRKEKLLAVFDLFHKCYKIVVFENLSKSNNRLLGSNMPRIIKNFVLGRRQ